MPVQVFLSINKIMSITSISFFQSPSIILRGTLLFNTATTYVDVAPATSASASYSIRVMITTATKDASTDMSIITFTP